MPSYAEPARGLTIVELGLRMSNADVTDKMRVMKHIRETGAYSNVVCCVTGFNHDPRELWDIPEVRAFCRRLVALGFPAFLDLVASADPQTNGAFGAAELIWVSEGRMPPAGALNDAAVERLNAAIVNSRKLALQTLGPFVPVRLPGE